MSRGHQSSHEDTQASAEAEPTPEAEQPPAPAPEPEAPPAPTLEERVAKLEAWIPRLEAIVGAP